MCDYTIRKTIPAQDTDGLERAYAKPAGIGFGNPCTPCPIRRRSPAITLAAQKNGLRHWRSVLLLLANLWSIASFAQELTPRAYWPTPEGTNVLVLGYQNTFGSVLTDPSLPVTGVRSDINYLLATYQHTFNWFSRTAIVQVSAPYSWGTTKGYLEGQYRDRKTSGIADTQVRFAINLRGAPSMDQEGFRELLANPKTIIGASLLLKIPTGEYQADKLINVGANRWAVKPALGVIWPIMPSLLFEFEAGVWIHGNNHEFLGQTRKQKPIYSTEAHLVKITRSDLWVSLDVNFYKGGRTSVGETTQGNLQRNSRMGVTLFFPWKHRHGLRASYSKAIATSSGGDFNLINLSYTYAWR